MLPPPKYSVLCFGDSNTWGFVPGTGARYDLHTRWPGVLQQHLGADYRVIEEGFNGRTTIWDDAMVPGRNGKQYLGPCLGSHRPLDLVVLFLGLNDMKAQFGATAQEIARGASTLMEIIRRSEAGVNGASPRTLVLSPPRVGKLTQYAVQFEGCGEKSAQLGGCLGAAAREAGCEFVDTAELIVTSDADGIHLDAAAHRTVGCAVAERVRQMLAAGN